MLDRRQDLLLPLVRKADHWFAAKVRVRPPFNKDFGAALLCANSISIFQFS